jgi:hypothetical protein
MHEMRRRQACHLRKAGLSFIVNPLFAEEGTCRMLFLRIPFFWQEAPK